MTRGKVEAAVLNADLCVLARVHHPHTSLAPVVHFRHPTRGDGTLCGWIGIQPAPINPPRLVCTACRERMPANVDR